MQSTLVKFEDRGVILQQQRNLKMARSAHAYVRGSTIKFYEWLEQTAAKSLPQGPPVWICGDCHLGNLGPVANAKGAVEIEIRDLDQTVIGNPTHDLVRLALSLATAIRGSDLPGVTTALVLERMMDGYENALSGRSVPRRMSEPVRVVLQRAVRRRWRHLAEERIENVTPAIPLGKHFWSLSPQEKKEIERVFRKEKVVLLVTSLRRRDSGASVRVLDAAYWMKGCSSLGRLRYAVLLGIGKPKHYRHGGLCLIDIKEAVRAAAPYYRGSQMPENNAERVVEGAKKLSPFLGQRMMAEKFLGRQVVLRELLPQDLKLEMDQLTRDDAIAAAHFLASVVGRAHARQMDSKDRKKWRDDLNRNRLKSLDAPSWLWRSVVDLSSIHESAYLEHCRQYALKMAHPAK
jgi:uncharacterized protein (DUF2252 family)